MRIAKGTQQIPNGTMQVDDRQHRHSETSSTGTVKLTVSADVPSSTLTEKTATIQKQDSHLSHIVDRAQVPSSYISTAHAEMAADGDSTVKASGNITSTITNGGKAPGKSSRPRATQIRHQNHIARSMKLSAGGK